MTQPLAGAIALLRDIYSPRFSRLVFIVPFEQVDEDDVVTVYRAPYTRAGYITDALSRLQAESFDYLMVIDHDVLLNPRIDERSFTRFFPLKADEGFYPAFGPLPEGMGGWSRYFGLVPKLAFPKSLLFGSGLEKEVLRHFLPDRDESVHKYSEVGMAFRTAATLQTRSFGDIVAAPSRVLLHGETAALRDGTAAQRAADHFSVAAERALIAAMANAISADETDEPAALPRADLTVPLSAGSVPACLYVLPRSRLERFAHYAGVAAAANLDTELIVPTLLHLLCDRVRSAADFSLSVRGLIYDPDLAGLVRTRLLAVGSFEGGWFQGQDDRTRLLKRLAALGAGRHRRASATVGVHRMGRGGTLEAFADEGWHPRESWGRWMAQPYATLRFWVPRDADLGALRISFIVPIRSEWPAITTEVWVNDDEPVLIQTSTVSARAEVTFAAGVLRPGTINRVALYSDRVLRPAVIDPRTGDRRRIGIGITAIEFTSAADPDRFASSAWLFPALGEREVERAPVTIGFHGHEVWGSWSAGHRATALFTIVPTVTIDAVRVRLRAPLHEKLGRAFTGRIRLNGGVAVEMARSFGEPDIIEVDIDPADVRHHDLNVVDIVSDMLVSPADIEPGNMDRRQFGFGLVDITIMTPRLDALQLPSAASVIAGHERVYRMLTGGDRQAHVMLAAPGLQHVRRGALPAFTGVGWHDFDDFGCWSSARSARFPIWVPVGLTFERIVLSLQSPPRASDSVARGRARVNDGTWVAIEQDDHDRRFAFLSAEELVGGQVNWIEVVSRDMGRPSDLVPESADNRLMGFALLSVDFR